MSRDVSSHIRKELLTNGISNAVFNGLAAWLLLRHKDFIGFWASDGIAVDIAATAVILLFIVALIIIPLNHSGRRKGKAPAFQWDNSRALHRLWQRFPSSLLGRAACFSLLGLIVVAPVSFIPYVLLGIDGMSGTSYALCKGIWAGLMAAILCVPMIQMGLADPLPDTAGVGN